VTDTVLLFGKQVGREAMARFKRSYEMARARGAEQFQFDGQEVLVAFAKYLLQYAEQELGVL
jgi:hypothetical protein